MTETAHLILTVTRLRAQRLALWMERLWQTGQASPDQGQAIGSGEVARLLAPDTVAHDEIEFFAQGGPAALSLRIEQADADLAADAGWSALCQTFGLTQDEADLLALLVSAELDPGLARATAYLHDDGRLTQPTPWLAQRMAGRQTHPFEAPNIERWLLATPSEGADPKRLMTPWQADPIVAHAVFSGIWQDRSENIVRLAGDDIAALPVLHAPALATLQKISDPRDCELVGAPGIGRQTLAAQFAASRGQSLLSVDLQTSNGTSAPQAITRALREAAMTGAMPYFRNAENAGEPAWTRARALGVPYLRGVRHPTGEAVPVALAPLAIDARLDLWRFATNAPPPDSLISQRLTPAEIVHAAAEPSQTLSKPRGRRPDHSLLNLLPTPYTWDDLVLPAEIADQLHAFETQVRLRWIVYEQWGFARLTHLGHGISALFGGPSGTGKTMAAQVLARSLGLDLLRVDLAGVVNKYIGETEKKLREVFDACEDSGAVLFFDEADALFGNRTQVKDAHDRFANIEIDYLLQRIERFDGVAILATNRRQDLDPAFVRRLRFVIEFLPPRPKERLALWQRALLPNAPNGQPIRGEIDWSYLSDRLNMTGAEIKSTALGAAFLARAEEKRIGMTHILTAAQRELAKQGLHLRAPLREAGE